MHDRILEHKPSLAYAKKKALFLNREFYIDNRVYVPNPETELMVEYAIKYISENNLENGTFIDVGTGCGNIAISLAKAFPNALIIASDISVDAIEVAKENVKCHQVKNIHFNTDLVKDIDIEPDLIIGNLPWGDDDHLLQTNTKEDLALMPPIAIFAPDGIIGSYVRLCQQIKEKKWNTILIAEVGLLEKEIIESNLPKEFNWEYITLPSEIFNYSTLKVTFKGEKANEITHHHLIYQATVNRKDLNEKSSELLVSFLNDIVSVINMQILIPPQVAFSHQKAWTGLVGIVTSHISFHFWSIESYLQLDIYSCKKFDISKTITFLDNFWNSKNKNILFIERGHQDDFKITKL